MPAGSGKAAGRRGESSLSFEPEAYILTFRTLHAVLRAERRADELRPRGVPRPLLIPVPRGIASDCGFCLRFPADGLDPKILRKEMEDADIEDAWLVEVNTEDVRRIKEKRYERIP